MGTGIRLTYKRWFSVCYDLPTIGNREIDWFMKNAYKQIVSCKLANALLNS
jgi:hypothetical protein